MKNQFEPGQLVKFNGTLYRVEQSFYDSVLLNMPFVDLEFQTPVAAMNYEVKPLF